MNFEYTAVTGTSKTEVYHEMVNKLFEGWIPVGKLDTQKKLFKTIYKHPMKRAK